MRSTESRRLQSFTAPINIYNLKFVGRHDNQTQNEKQ